MTLSPVPVTPRRISDIMQQLMDSAGHEDKITIGTVLYSFGVRGFAFLLFLLALLNIVIFMVPLASILFGLPMVILAAQMVLGVHTPIFPSVIRRQTIPRRALMRGLERAIRGMAWVERYIKPRLAFLTHPTLYRLHGMVALVLAVMVSLPIPVFNVPPSIALVLLGIGLLERDGFFILAAYTAGFWCLYLFKSLGSLAQAFT